jgi:hypothetical protein
MDRERAEAHLRLLAEEELRRAAARSSDDPAESPPADDVIAERYHATTWIEVVTTGRSAEARARLPLRWE